MKKTSLKDIAKHLNVSVSAVSLTLNGKGDEARIRRATQEKIIEYAQSQNYSPNSFAKGLAKGRSEMIGLIVPNISDAFFSRIARCIEKCAELSGYDVIFSSTGDDPDKVTQKIKSMLDRQVDGLILAPCQENEQDILMLKRNGFPFVLIDRNYPDVETNFVGFENAKGVSLAVQQLIDSGRKRIGFVTLSTNLGTLQERLDGYVHTMEANGHTVEESFVHTVNYDNIEDDMPQVITDVVKQAKPLDALVFSTQYLAVHGIRCLKDLHVKVPDDMAIISYGQKNDFDLFSPAISSLNLPINEMGDLAVNMLMKTLKKPKCKLEFQLLLPELIVRESSQ